MKRGRSQQAWMAGFTIVETMIVLAVTGILFVTIVTTWGGRQHKNEFATATGDIRSQIQEVITQTQAGYFPDSANFKCELNGSGIRLSSGTVAQGQNQDCVFLGKVMQLGFTGTDPEQLRTYSVAGRRSSSATTLPAINPTVLATSSVSGMSDISEPSKLLYGLTSVDMKVKTSTGAYAAIGSFGFLSQLGSFGVSGSLSSGVQQLDLYALKTTRTPSSSFAAASDINTALNSASDYYLNRPVYICFKSGGTSQYALVTIGADSNNLTADLTITTTANCGI